MRVVSNTSPLTNLAAIGQFELLRLVFGRIHIPDAVWEELNADDMKWPGRDEAAQADWIERRPSCKSPLSTDLCLDLGAGEAESIALAIELDADVILLDETEARNRAERLGLVPVGVCGVLLAAKKAGHIREVRRHLDALRRRAGFYLSNAVYSHVLSLAGEK